ncbi:helix-turn-helix domain-containing protein [Metabacillus sp. Hm71]|uniref:helix-turn-helix domain-containing protein n=1 Tax=Metabacillus sp. Hm71 TaxID=3450743 RepID=UPI003F4223BD
MLKADDLPIIRDFYNLTTNRLADICNLSQSYVAMIENGHRPITINVERRIIDQLGLNADIIDKIRKAAEEYEKLKRDINGI